MTNIYDSTEAAYENRTNWVRAVARAASQPTGVDRRTLSELLRCGAPEHDSAIITFDPRLVSPISSIREGDRPRHIYCWIMGDGNANASGNLGRLDRGLPRLAKRAGPVMALAAKWAVLLP